LSISVDRKGVQEPAHSADRCLLVKPIVTSAAILLALANAAPAFAQAQGTGQEPCSLAGDSSKSLSEKLDQGGGVICPPNIDPAIKAPTPQTGRMPVIPPPGSPGGDPKVQPK
jgi:hypothetical protein